MTSATMAGTYLMVFIIPSRLLQVCKTKETTHLMLEMFPLTILKQQWISQVWYLGPSFHLSIQNCIRTKIPEAAKTICLAEVPLSMMGITKGITGRMVPLPCLCSWSWPKAVKAPCSLPAAITVSTQILRGVPIPSQGKPWQTALWTWKSKTNKKVVDTAATTENQEKAFRAQTVHVNQLICLVELERYQGQKWP